MIPKEKPTTKTVSSASKTAGTKQSPAPGPVAAAAKSNANPSTSSKPAAAQKALPSKSPKSSADVASDKKRSSSPMKAKASSTSKQSAVSTTKTAAAKPSAAKAAATTAETKPKTPEAPSLTEEELLERRKKVEQEMEALAAVAYKAQVDMERKQAETKQKEVKEEARKRKEESVLRKTLLEAAYDDNVVGLDNGLKSAAEMGLKDVFDISDGHGNTLLSEAAAGGAVASVKKLLSMDADPNSKGEFGRTPLWRAAFLGQDSVIQILLEGGADPRIGNEAGELPQHVAANAQIKGAIEAWDTSMTDQWAEDWQTRKMERELQQAAAAQAVLKGAEEECRTAQAKHDAAQDALKRARVELEKRIHEHDMCVVEKKPEDLIAVTLEQIKAAESVVTNAQQQAAAAAQALDMARLALRKQQAGMDAELGEEAIPGMKIHIKELDDVLLRDVGNVIESAGKWPLVIDTTGQASVFLRYTDTNFVNAVSPAHTEADALRRSLLGAIRYGKPLVLDMLDVNLWTQLALIFDAIEPGLWTSLLSKALVKNEKYASLVRPADGEQYEPNMFQDALVAKFKLVVLTSQRSPDKEMIAALYPISIIVKR